MIEDVEFTHNASDIRARMRNIDGVDVDLVIGAGDAQIDRDGVIRSFTAYWDDGAVTHYKLLPKHSKAAEVAAYMTAFLGGFGLSRVGANLVKGNRMVDHLTRYGVFGFAGGMTMKSFAKHLFQSHDLGYWNVVTHKLIFPGGALKAPEGTW